MLSNVNLALNLLEDCVAFFVNLFSPHCDVNICSVSMMLSHSPGISHLFPSFEDSSKLFSEFLVKKKKECYVCMCISLPLGIYSKWSLLLMHFLDWDAERILNGI